MENSKYIRGINYATLSVSVHKGEILNLDRFPSFSKTGSIIGMKKLYYGKDALLIKCGQYIYNVSSEPEIYFNL